MAGKADRLHEHESVRDVVARLLAAMESFAGRRTDLGGPPGSSARAGGPAVFLFSSMRAGQGTSTVAAAVARALAETGKRTVLAVVDAANAVSAPPGSIPLLDRGAGAAPIAFEQPPLLTLQVPPRFTDLPEAARDPRSWVDGVEVTIIDAPSLTNSLTCYWAPRVHGVVLVVDGERVAVRAVVEAREDLARIGGHLVGVVLNRYRSRIPRFLEPYFIYG